MLDEVIKTFTQFINLLVKQSCMVVVSMIQYTSHISKLDCGILILIADFSVRGTVWVSRVTVGDDEHQHPSHGLRRSPDIIMVLTGNF